MKQVKTRIDDARQQAAAAQAQVAAISHKLLAQLLKLPSRQAANHIPDPRLTAEDRAVLQAHLQKQLPAQLRKLRVSRVSAVVRVRSILLWPSRHIGLVMVCVAVAAFAHTIWANTPQTIAVVRFAENLEIRWPDGSLQVLTDNYAVVGREDGQWLIRVWRPFMGYEIVPVADNSLIRIQ